MGTENIQADVDETLEVVRFLVVAALLVFLLRLGRRQELSRVGGWRLLLIGFGLLTFGSAIDITDNFPSLDRFVLIGSTPAQSVLEKAVGYTAGFVCCALGLFRWLTSYTAQHEELKLLRVRLENEVAERTRELLDKAEELQAMNQGLRELASARSTLVARVSHEFRTPLTAVIGFASLLRRDMEKACAEVSAWGRAPEELQERIQTNLEIIAEESRRLLAMVEDILDLAALERANLAWRDRDTDLTEVVRRAMHSVSGVFAEKPALLLSCECDKDLPRLNLDPDRLHQVLVNLLTNAAKYSDSGPVTVRAGAGDGAVRISVSDHGRGIPEERQLAVFQLFERGDCDPNSGSPIRGNGIGLAIAREIVEHYGGDIEVASAVGQGSVFTVRLPVSEGGAEPA